MTTFASRLRQTRGFNELAGLAVVILACTTFLALSSYSGLDVTWFQDQGTVGTQNWIGRAGATLAEGLLQLFGVAALLLPFFLGFVGWRIARPREGDALGPGPALIALSFVTCILLDLLFEAIAYGGARFPYPGGAIGHGFAGVLTALLAVPGALIFSTFALVGCVVWATRGRALKAAPLLWRATRHGGELAWSKWRERSERATVEAKASSPVASMPAKAVAAPAAPSRPMIALKPKKPTPAPAPAPKKQSSLPLDPGRRGYSLPPLELLNEPEPQDRENEQELLERAQQITEKFSEFAIDGAVVAIHPGPVVTTFEFKPDAGVKYSKLTGMTDDLSLALKAESVRIDRMAGRSTVGIEVPNRNQETIFPRDLIGSERFRESKSKLTLALAKDIHGDVQTAELDRMPHLLIAGATGAGKSVGLNGMIISLVYKSTPRDLRFIMIDTKMIELGIYAGIPHLLIPVVTEAKNASKALQWAVREMEQRYKKLATCGVRNIAQFNALLEEEPDRTMPDPKSGEPVPLTHLPYLVIVIDEMADLMMIAAADVEESIMRLAQMARAVGIHLILATQRPSVDVITGTIKANFPSRIAFRVSQRVDSRTIIDRQGAESLLGRGDMLMLMTGSARLVRMHSGFITEAEINRVTEFLKKMAEPVYDESILKDPDEGRGGVDGAARDEMFDDAVRTVINEGKCSITLLQRRLQLGYARAARIVDMMEQAGVVGPGEGSKPREILVPREYLDSLEDN